MELTKEFLEQHKEQLGRRIARLRQQRVDLDASIWATDGAIRNCDYLLEELAKPEPASSTEPEPGAAPTPH